MEYRVELSTRAASDLDELLDWLVQNNAGQTGARWLAELETSIASLTSQLERCAVAPESARFSFTVRHLLHGRKPHVYRILFTIDGDVVHVLHIRHGRRRPWGT